MNLRPYQLDALLKIRESLEQHPSTLAVLATGLGKTVLFSHVAHSWDSGRVLIIAHRDELIRQAAEKLHAITGDEPGIEMGDESVDDAMFGGPPKIIVSSVQTMSRPKRQARFNPKQFGLTIIDEAHHAVASTYRSVIEYFADAKLLGVTATPQRADTLALGQVFQSVAYDYGIEPAIQDGWLVPVSQQAVKVEGLDFSKVRTVAGDMNEADLERILVAEEMLHKIAAPTVEIAGDRPALIFCVTVAHAEQLAAIINRYKPESALALSGKTPMEDRRDAVERYKRGEIQFLCNCALFLEGFDAPTTSLVVMARPTKSLTLYVQVLGRGTRPLPGIVDGIELAELRRAAIRDSGKSNMIVLDFVGNSGHHKIISAADVLGGRYGEPVRKLARENAEREGRPAPVAEGLERARDEIEFMSDFEKLRKKIVAEARYRTSSVSPFTNRQHSDGSGPNVKPLRGGATEKQVNYLVHLGVSRDVAEGYSVRQAGAVIDSLKKKQEATAGDHGRGR